MEIEGKSFDPRIACTAAFSHGGASCRYQYFSIYRFIGYSWHLEYYTYLIFFDLRCFDTVFQRPYRYFSIALKVVFSLSDRYKIFTSNWLWIEICENVVFSKIDIIMTTINEKLETGKSRILCDLDLLLKIQH